MRRFFGNRPVILGVVRPGLPAVLYALALLALLIQFAFAIRESVAISGAALAFPYPLAYGEGPLLDQVVRLSRGENIYPADLTQPPFSVTQQGPLFPAIQVPFYRIFGPAYAYGRAISLLSAILTAVFIGLTLFTLTRDWIAAATGVLLLLSIPFFLYASVLDIAGAPALALSWAGLYLTVRSGERRLSLLVAATLFSLAIFTCQTTFLAGPLAATAWLAQKRRYRRAAALAGITAGICAVIFLILNAATRGGFSFHLITAGSAAPFSWKTVTAHWVRMLPNLFYLMIGTVLFLMVERFGDRTETWPLVLPYFLGALVASTAFSGRAAQDTFAFLEVAAAFSLAAGAILAWAGKSAWTKVFLALILVVQVGALVNWTRQEYVPSLRAKVAAESDVAEAVRLARESGGPLLADEFMGLAPLAGQPIYFQPVEFKALSEAGLWDANLLVSQVAERRFPVILLYIPQENSQILVSRWSPTIRNAIWDNYELVDRQGFLFVYAPRR